MSYISSRMNYINAKATKELALHIAKTNRPAWGPERVSREFLERIDARVRAMVTNEVMAHPSKGKTIY